MIIGIFMGVLVIAIGGGYFYTADKSYVRKYELTCIFKGMGVSSIDEYIYQCCYHNETRNFTSNVKDSTNPSHPIIMYQSCDNSTTLVHDKDDICHNYYADAFIYCIIAGVIIVLFTPLIGFYYYSSKIIARKLPEGLWLLQA